MSLNHFYLSEQFLGECCLFYFGLFLFILSATSGETPVGFTLCPDFYHIVGGSGYGGGGGGMPVTNKSYNLANNGVECRHCIVN